MQTQQTQSNDIETNCPNCGSAWNIRSGLGVCGYCGTEMPEPPPLPPPVVLNYSHTWTTTTTGGLYNIVCSGVVGPGYPQNNFEDPAILANRRGRTWKYDRYANTFREDEE